VRKLRSEPMASLDLYFKRKLPAVPAGHVVLLGSKYDLTFIDNSHVWPGETCTNLNVVASEFDTLNFDDVAGASKPADARLTEAQAMHYILEELRRYVPFDDADIDHDKTHIQTNTGEALFVNEVGSWSYRPGTRCSIPNLFLAGDFCRSVIDVVTVEAAVVTGLMAAEALRSEAGQGTPIRVVEPRSYPESAMAMLTLMGAPYAYAAKMWASWCQESRSALGRVLPPAGPGDS